VTEPQAATSEQPAAAATEATAAVPAAPAAQSTEAPPKVSAEAEQRAATLLADTTGADTLSEEALRERVDQYRDLLSDPDLSSKTSRALRKRLKEDRQVLRARVAAKEAAAAEAAQKDAAAQQQAAAPEQPKAATEQPATEQQAVAVKVSSRASASVWRMGCPQG